ncbi:uncharacterized protein EI90DRAFT_3127521 [Cantharellus anzutake]|uniref:uncharacterized protein n=1 Tax=Cantharellus anzutake TaxID=1750568 RepID=UPI0019073D62|nr:uncharacterized protein EI90DRAFT_3127521 [Cantharellus anzutake]KAF8327020.1 hypothetical protein EI90DRAFT_3127521 [Cantharellus anzutake]
MVKKGLGSPSAKRTRVAVQNNAQTLDSAGVPSVNTPDIPPDPGETDNPDTSPGPPGDLDALGPSQSTTTVVPAVVAPLPLEEDPPNMPVGPDPFADAPGSPDPLRSGEALGLGDGPDNSVEVVNAIEDLRAWIYHPSPGLAGSQIPLNSPQFEATSVPPPVPVRGRDREPIQRRNSLVDKVSADEDYVRTTTYRPVPGHPSVRMTTYIPHADEPAPGSSSTPSPKRIPSYLKGKSVNWGPQGLPVVLRRTQPLPQLLPAPEAPIVLESSTDEGETDRDLRLTWNLCHGSGPALVMNAQGKIKKKQRTIFAPCAPSETSVEYGTQMDGDAVYMHRPEGLDNHAREIRCRLGSYSRFTTQDPQSGALERLGQDWPSRVDAQQIPLRASRQEISTPQPTIRTLQDPLGGASHPIVVSPVKREREPSSQVPCVASSVHPRMVSSTIPHDGFVESTLRSYSRDLSSLSPSDPEGFMEELVC